MTKRQIVCFAELSDPSLFELLEFYREDLSIFRELGFEVVPETRAVAAGTSNGDALFVWCGVRTLPVVLAWRLRNRVCVITGATGFRDAGHELSRRILRLVFTVVASWVAHRTLAVSALEMSDLRRFGARNAELGYHSVDVEFFVPGPRSSTPRAITVGQINPRSVERKGIDMAIAATSLVRQQISEYELDVVGPISEEGAAWLEEAAHRHDFTGVNVCGLASREEKRALLQRAWLYLQPSRYEAFGVAMVEAMACGAVPVHSSGGALPEIAGGYGLLLEPRTPEALARLIVERLKSDAGMEELGRRARERSLEFSRAARASRLSGLFDELGVRPKGSMN